MRPYLRPSLLWTADLRIKTLGEELSKGEETKYAPLLETAQDSEPAKWKA